MVDLDGSFEYSDILFESLDCINAQELFIYPNPIVRDNGVLNIEFYSPKNEIKIQISDILGRTVKLISLDTETESMISLQLDVKELPSGIYTIHLVGEQSSKMFLIEE